MACRSTLVGRPAQRKQAGLPPGPHPSLPHLVAGAAPLSVQRRSQRPAPRKRRTLLCHHASPPHTHARKHSQTHALAASAGSHRARFTLCAGSRARSSPHATLNRVLLNSHPFIATHTPSPLFISKLGSPAMQGDLSTLALPAPSHPPQPIYVCLKAQRRSPYPLPAPVGDRLQKTPAKSGVCQSSMQTGQPPSQCTAAARPRPNMQTRRLVLLFPPLHTVGLCDCGAGWRPPAGASRPSRTLCRPKIRIRRISNGGTDSRMLFDATPSPRLLQLPSWLQAMPRIHPT